MSCPYDNDAADRYVSGKYVMSVAARICGMHPQTLRKYERAGFVSPSRSSGQRLYSDLDIAQLRSIKHLVDDLGLNLAGVGLALELGDRTARLLERLDRMEMGEADRQQLRREIGAMLKLLQSEETARHTYDLIDEGGGRE